MENIVLTTASSYDFETLRPFFESLYNTNYKGDCVLFLGEHENKTYHKLKAKFPIKIIRYKNTFPFFIDQVALAEQIPRIPDFVPHPKTLRYLLYYAFLKANEKYKYALIADSRDVIFQKDPFDFHKQETVYTFQEDESENIKSNYFNSLWIREAFGKNTLEEIKDNYILCSGVTIGHFRPFMEYLEVMINYILIVKDKGCKDQGIHNYIIRTKKFENIKIVSDDTGVVSTISHFKPKNKIKINKNNLVLDVYGNPIHIVHQYDRELKLLRHYSFRNYLQRKIGLWKKKFYFLVKPFKKKESSKVITITL